MPIPTPDARPHDAAAKRCGQLREHAVLLIVVIRLDRFEECAGIDWSQAVFWRLHILGSTSLRTPAREEEGRAMRSSLPMPLRTTSTFAPTRSQELGDVVHERDASREHGVRRVLRHLGGRSMKMIGRPVRTNGVQLGHHAARVIRLGAEHDAVRLHEVVDGGAFLETRDC
jgi:hypothetical protein